MTKSYYDRSASAIGELDNRAYIEQPCTIIFYFGTNDDGERYVDAEIVRDYPMHNLTQTASIMAAADLFEAIVKLGEAVDSEQ